MAVDRRLLARPAIEVAPLLLGARLRSRIDGDVVDVRITEVEAYEGEIDPASHAYRGRTARNAVMFGEAGHLYCYFVYGMHWCANITCGRDGVAAAVLLRAAEVVEGVSVARRRTPATLPDRKLASGPARLARVLGLDGRHTGLDVVSQDGNTSQAPPGRTASDADSVTLLSLGDGGGHHHSGPRVGIRVGTEVHWRFWVAGDQTVSEFRGPPRRRLAGS